MNSQKKRTREDEAAELPASKKLKDELTAEGATTTETETSNPQTDENAQAAAGDAQNGGTEAVVPAGEVAVGDAAAQGQTTAEGVLWVAPPIADPKSGRPTQICILHGKRRTLQNLRVNRLGQWQCTEMSACKDTGAPGPNARAGAYENPQAAGLFECCLHGKMRSLANLRPNGPGIYACMPGRECKGGRNFRGPPGPHGPGPWGPPPGPFGRGGPGGPGLYGPNSWGLPPFQQQPPPPRGGPGGPPP